MLDYFRIFLFFALAVFILSMDLLMDQVGDKDLYEYSELTAVPKSVKGIMHDRTSTRSKRIHYELEILLTPKNKFYSFFFEKEEVLKALSLIDKRNAVTIRYLGGLGWDDGRRIINLRQGETTIIDYYDIVNEEEFKSVITKILFFIFLSISLILTRMKYSYKDDFKPS
jgi:hypothetical protein